MSSDWKGDYFQRVRPVLGDVFRQRHVACWGLATGYGPARALAQSGIFHQTFFDDLDVDADSFFARSLGSGSRGRPRAEALESALLAHNGFERDWTLATRPRDVPALRACLRGNERPDLLLAELDANAPAVLRAAIDASVPIILSWLPARAVFGSLTLVWHPDSKTDRDALLDLVLRLATLPSLADRAEAHCDALEEQSLVLSLARWLLARDRPERPDLDTPILQQGRAIVLRGEPSWPWSVRFVRPVADVAGLCGERAAPHYRPPSALFSARESVLVLGLGTASLFCAEAPLFAKRLVLLDCKAVSPFNPVRQVYGTDRIGQPKGQALAEIIAQRVSNDATWDRDELAGLGRMRSDTHELVYGELMLSRRERGSTARFAEILEATRPSLAIVAMGRSKDDNFLATAELRRRGIPHITPTAFPGVSHFKHIITDGESGPCYDCLQGHLAIDGGAGPTLQPEEREIFYGGTQPATLAETLPSATSLLRLARDLALPRAARPPYLRRELAAERNCFVGANRVEHRGPVGRLGGPTQGEGWLYGVDQPFRMVSYGIEHLVGSRAQQRCPCGRVNVAQPPKQPAT